MSEQIYQLKDEMKKFKKKKKVDIHQVNPTGSPAPKLKETLTADLKGKLFRKSENVEKGYLSTISRSKGDLGGSEL